MKKELEAAYRDLDKAEQAIIEMRREMNKALITLDLLEKGGYIALGKRAEAERFCNDFYNGKP